MQDLGSQLMGGFLVLSIYRPTFGGATCNKHEHLLYTICVTVVNVRISAIRKHRDYVSRCFLAQFCFLDGWRGARRSSSSPPLRSRILLS
jgi:hypothetical protein